MQDIPLNLSQNNQALIQQVVSILTTNMFVTFLTIVVIVVNRLFLMLCMRCFYNDRNEILSKPGLVGLVFFSISALVLDHLKPQFSSLKTAEVALCEQLWSKRVCFQSICNICFCFCVIFCVFSFFFKRHMIV